MTMLINPYVFAAAVAPGGGGTGLWVVDMTDAGIYPFDPATGATGTFIDLSAAGGTCRDVAFDSNGDYWLANSTRYIRKFTGGTNTQVDSIYVTESSRGVAVDSNGDLWVNDAADILYRYTTAGTLLNTASAPGSTSNIRGMSFTSGGLLAYVSSAADTAYFADVSTPSSPTLSRSFTFASDLTGISIAADETEWVSSYNAKTINEFPAGTTGTLPTATQSDAWPGSQNYGLAWDVHFS